MSKINCQLCQLWGGTIETLEIDLVSHTIHFQVVVPTSEKITKTDLKFLGVRAMCFGDNFLDSKLVPSFMECTSIEVRDLDIATLGVSFHTDDANSYLIHPNIVMELDNGVSFWAVLAEKISINGTQYPLMEAM